MPQTLALKAKGVYTEPNPLNVPEGALLQGDNIVIDRDDIHEIRRGLKLYGTTLTASKLFNYQNRLLAHAGTTMNYDSDNAGTWSPLSGSFSAPTGAQRIRAMEANKNFYFTTATGIKKMDAYNGTPSSAGMPKGLDGSGATSGASGFMSNNQQVAYRVTWGKIDANGNTVEGAPSQRIIVTNNSGGTRDVDLEFTVPSGITTSHFYRIYRSAQSGGVSTEPNDELQLIVEKNPTAGQITALNVTYTDSTPDNLRGTSLYTNPNQQGILQANDAPPIAKDVAFFKDSAIYANVVSIQRLFMTLISVGGSVGLVNGDTITIAGVVYTGAGTEDVATGTFLVASGGTAAQNIDSTARSLIKVINRYASNTSVYAYYLSGYNDLPGRILIEERVLGGGTFVAISSRGGAFSPTIPSSGTSYVSSNETKQHFLYVAKSGQPEAVPILNTIPVGSAQYPIRRIIALRDSLVVLKDDGVFRLTGESFSDFRVSLFDSTTIIKGEETAVAFNNQVFCLSTQGVVAISDSGVAIMSRAIENVLIQLMSSQYTNFESTVFAFSYESERKYGLGIVTETDDTYPTQIFIYNSITNTWVRWLKSVGSGIVSLRDNKLYLGSADPDMLYVLQERKAYNLTDYAEREIAVSINGYSGAQLTLNDTTGIEAGWSVAQLNAAGSVPLRKSIVVTVDDATHVTVRDSLTWSIGPGTVYEPIPVEMMWAPIHGGNPAILKQFVDQVTIFLAAAFRRFNFSYTSDMSISEETVELAPLGAAPWGLFMWPLPTRGIAWGGGNPNLQPIRTFVPKEKEICHWINLSSSIEEALTQFSIVGLAFFFDEISVRMK